MAVVMIRLGRVQVRITTEEVVTRFEDGKGIRGHLREQPGQAEMALDLGYENAEAMNREHDLAHSLLSYWLGLVHSPTLYGQAIGRPSAFWREEEAAVLALQRYARTMGIDLVEVAEAVK
jgi:hypothetical protein